MPFGYRVDQDFKAEYRGAIFAAMRLWDALTVEPAIRFDGVGQYRNDEIVYNNDNHNRNVIHATNEPYWEWKNECPPTARCKPSYSGHGVLVDMGYVAVAVPRIGKGNQILDCDLYLYEFQKNFIDGRWDYNYEGRVVNLIQTIAHEMGHCFGIFHSDDPASIMYPTGHLKADALGWDFIEISADDAAEFYSRYPWLTPFSDDWWSEFNSEAPPAAASTAGNEPIYHESVRPTCSALSQFPNSFALKHR